ncbi:MAG: hypothetical protein GY777_31860 [Candidatus Brocadiaceae bacterium]|nr:hypothetical protein [Candidatus Brocadiaceae bacterium]
MLISNIKLEIDGDYKLLKADVIWENCNRPKHELFFKFLKDQEVIDPVIIADPFLTACAPIAYRHGEKRLYIEGNVCPLLVENIYTAIGYLHDWYWYEYDLKKSASIEFKIEADSMNANKINQSTSASLFSGGADSLDLLISNYKIFSKNHYLKIKSAIYIHGLDFGNRPKRGNEEEFFSSTRLQFNHILQKLDINLVPVWTNIRSLDKDTHGWKYETHGSAMAAVGQCLSNYIGNVWLASTYAIPQLSPWGSHPILDRCYSSSSINIHHARERIFRIEKIKNIAEIPDALNILRVCFFGDSDNLNCGHCEKCIRTKIALLICDKLDAAESMPNKEITFNDIIKMDSLSKNAAIFTRECMPALVAKGRYDLALALRLKLLSRILKKLFDYKYLIKIIDKVILEGRIKRSISKFKK